MIGGKHVQHGTKRRLSYSAWYELVGSRLYITASVRYGDRTLATPDLEEIYQPEGGSEEDAVVAALVRYMNEAIFDFSVGSTTSKPECDPSPPQPASARSAWAELRAGGFGQ